MNIRPGVPVIRPTVDDSAGARLKRVIVKWWIRLLDVAIAMLIFNAKQRIMDRLVFWRAKAQGVGQRGRYSRRTHGRYARRRHPID